jgi:hypothetical protein
MYGHGLRDDGTPNAAGRENLRSVQGMQRQGQGKAALPWCLCVDVQNVQRVLKLVGYFHPPSVARRQLTVYALQHLPCRDCSFPPSGMFVRQFLALVVEFGSVVIGVKEIPWHQIALTSAAVIRGSWPIRQYGTQRLPAGLF